MISSAALTCASDFIDVSDLPQHLQKPRASATHLEESWRPLRLEEVRQVHIRRVLEMCNGNRVRASQILGIGRTSLYRYLKRAQTSSGENRRLKRPNISSILVQVSTPFPSATAAACFCSVGLRPAPSAREAHPSRTTLHAPYRRRPPAAAMRKSRELSLISGRRRSQSQPWPSSSAAREARRSSPGAPASASAPAVRRPCLSSRRYMRSFPPSR